MNFPFISIVVAVYNAGPYLTRCLDSVSNQTFHDFEAILVNDASTDNSMQIMETYTRKDSRFKIIVHEQNCGMVKSRKTGISAANGQYVTFLDADDEFLPDFLQNAIPYMQKSRYDIIHFGISVEGKHIKASVHAWFENYTLPHETELNGDAIFKNYFLEAKIPWSLVGNFYRSDFIKKYNRFSISRCTEEDFFRMTILLYYAESFLYVRKRGYVYHYGCGISGKEHYTIDQFSHFAGAIEVFRFLKDFFLQENLPAVYMRRLNKREQEVCLYTFQMYEKLRPNDREKGLNILLKTWGTALLSQQILEFYYSATHSMSWKITAPLRVLYDFMKYSVPEFIKRLLGQRRKR